MPDDHADPPPPTDLDVLRAVIRAAYRIDEDTSVKALLARAGLVPEQRNRVRERARVMVEAVREDGGGGGLDAFLGEYGLDTEEGVILMCLAEALLRIPDTQTADRLIRDKLMDADWDRHIGQSSSLLVNASTWGLMLTGRIVRLDTAEGWGRLARLISKSGEPVIRQALTQAMRILSRQFVLGRTIEDALSRAEDAEAQGFRHSYDMLGEAAHTAADAARYFDAYASAIGAIGEAARALTGEVFAKPSISVKLSALHPRFEYAQRERVIPELGGRLSELARIAGEQGIGLTVDAEEAERLDLSLDLIERVHGDASLEGWEGFGLAVQAYQKRALPLIAWLGELARANHRRIPVRLVKGAYWDTEVKRAQERGLEGYPTFTRKVSTDVSYLACVHAMFEESDALYPQFATHNAHSAASVLELAGPGQAFEFQRLHGMGEALYRGIVDGEEGAVACRIYAPVGNHEDLLPYLVRRLLENGANTSFVNRISDLDAPIETIIADPVTTVAGLKAIPHPQIPLPADLFGAMRANSRGLELSDPFVVSGLYGRLERAVERPWRAAPIVGGEEAAGPARAVVDPADHRREIGSVIDARAAAVERALDLASGAAPDWAATPAGERAACLERTAGELESRHADFMAMAIREAGKTLPDALAEVREAVDFCRYYGRRARDDFAAPTRLPGPTGEDNAIALHGRGVFVCISPWNFPLAIFMGQVAAALAAGNAVIAKPAEQSPLIAAAAVRLLHEAGVPANTLHLLPGSGEVVGAGLVSDARIAGVAFTGSTETGRAINQAIAARSGPIVPLIAETGGQNAMVVDSSALCEQVVADTVASAFGAAGQRCSCLRVLFVQDDIAPRLLTMLSGAMDELVVGDPMRLATDVGPVIDGDAKAALDDHVDELDRAGKPLGTAPLGEAAAHGTFVQPVAYEIETLAGLAREHFGPVLHVVRYAADRLEGVIEAINATGFGLTLGIHTRIEETATYVRERVRVGNVYVNRNMIGAVVGVQPFGGEGLSGTGPKAGGPRYLHRFATERTVSIDTTAAGGNASLLSLQEEGD